MPLSLLCPCSSPLFIARFCVTEKEVCPPVAGEHPGQRGPEIHEHPEVSALCPFPYPRWAPNPRCKFCWGEAAGERAAAGPGCPGSVRPRRCLEESLGCTRLALVLDLRLHPGEGIQTHV